MSSAIPSSPASDAEGAHAPGSLSDLTKCVAALAEGRVSSTQLVQQTLEHIEATQPTLNAFRVVRAEGARAEAAEADRRIAAGERIPLPGVPIAIKDGVG